MCGIAGFSGIKNLTPQQARIATNKMKILGLYNQSRGHHGCGLYINDVIYKGVEDHVNKKNTKEFDDFLANKDFIWPELDVTKFKTMFLHTRQATHGSQVEANTHPFRIKPLEGNNDLVGVHNGTIENIWSDLCRKYEVDHIKHGIHVDSKALYTIIERHGTQVLSEYKGYAALIWARKDEPNSLYVYHGATYKDRSANRELWEERPMYFMHTAEGTYFSSLEESLNAIRESAKQEVKTLAYNTVFKITNGKFTNETVVIEREEMNLTPIYNYQNHNNVRKPTDTTVSDQCCNVRSPNFGKQKHLREIAEETSKSAALRESREIKEGLATKELGTPSESLVWRETVPVTTLASMGKETVRFYQGRYRRAGGNLCNGVLFIKDRGIIDEEGGPDVKPYWFWQGVLLKNIEAYESMVAESKVKDSWVGQLTSNWAFDVSRYASHPVTNLESEAVDANNFFRYAWYFDERIVNEAQFRPEWSGRTYTIVGGFCTAIIPSNADDQEVLIPSKTSTFNLSSKMGTDKEEKWQPTQQGTQIPLDLCCGYNETVGEDASDAYPKLSVFDAVVGDLKEFWPMLTPVHLQAMQEFVRDTLKEMWQCFPTEEEVQSELWTSVRSSVKRGQTIRQALGDNERQLETYMQLINESVITLATVHEKNANMADEVRYWEKNGYWPSEVRTPSSNKNEDDDDGLPWNYDNETEVDDETPKDGSYFDDIDKALAHVEAKRFKEDEMLVEACKHLDNVVATIHELSNGADDLQCMDDSDLAQDAANVIYRGVSTLKHDLTEVCDRHHQGEIIMKLNQIVQA